MKALTIKTLQNFVGKVCTVLTVGVSKGNFQDTQFSDFFTGFIESIDEDGIWARHHMTGCRNFYFLPHIVSIFEEQVIDQNNPEYEKILTEIKKSPPEQQANIVPINPNSQYVNPDVMMNLAKQAEDLQNKMVRKK